MKSTKLKTWTLCLIIFATLVVAVSGIGGLISKNQDLSFKGIEGYFQYTSTIIINKDEEDGKKKPPIDDSEIEIPKNSKYLGDIPLPEKWAWKEPEFELKVGTYYTYIVYQCDEEEAKEYDTLELEAIVTITKDSSKTDVWTIVLYVMIPVDVILTILYIIFLRRRKFKKKFLDEQDDAPPEIE